MLKGRGSLGSYGGKQLYGWFPEGGVRFKGGEEEERAVGGEQESRDNDVCRSRRWSN